MVVVPLAAVVVAVAVGVLAPSGADPVRASLVRSVSVVVVRLAVVALVRVRVPAVVIATLVTKLRHIGRSGG